eukprot:SAG11_NODE_9691_length_889_cov_1.832911_1_plen_133_part_00
MAQKALRDGLRSKEKKSLRQPDPPQPLPRDVQKPMVQDPPPSRLPTPMIQDPPPGKFLVQRSKRYNLKEKEPGPKLGEARRLEIRDERRALTLAGKRGMKPGETAAKSAQHQAQNLDQNGRRAMALVSRATP